MLLDKWIPQSYLVKSPIIGVECFYADDDSIRYNYSVVQSAKNKLEIKVQGTSIDFFEIATLAKIHSAPLVLCITGKGIITKKIIFSENDTLHLNELIKQHLPTIQADDFYIQFYKCNENTGYLTICRKQQVDALIQQLNTEKKECVNVFIGALVSNALAPLTNTYNRIYTSHYELQLTNGLIDVINPLIDNTKHLLVIDGLQIEQESVIAFASSFSYLTQQHNYESDNIELTNLFKRHIENNKFKVVLFVVIAIIFLVSAINSVLFFNKFEENNSLDVELNLYESKNTQITQLLESYQKKKNLIEQAGIFNNKHLSVYADKIAASLPEDILLRELNFNPIKGEAEEDSLIDFNENELIIKGNCNKSLLLNEWINVLKSQDFVKSANLENFIYNSEGHQPNFVLKVETK